MKIIPRLLVSASICATLGFSGIITGVSVIINDEPITLYEVYKYSKQYNISKKESINMLVRQKLEESQIKKLNITADIFEVDKYIDTIANKNNMNQYQFLNMLKSKNIKIADYKKDVKRKLKKEKLYNSIYATKLDTIEESHIKKFYNENKDQFQTAGTFDIAIYTARDQKDLKAIQKNPMFQPEGVNIVNKTIQASSLNEQLNLLLNGTKKGTFTQILNIENRPTMFFVKDKKDFTLIPYNGVKRGISDILSKRQRNDAVKNYFEKLKSSATIKVVRSPS